MTVRGRDWQQETYDTASRQAGRRARQLRQAGFRVSVASIGSQVTDVGRINMTLLTVHDIPWDAVVPEPEAI